MKIFKSFKTKVASTLDFKIEEETSKAIFECYH